MGALLDEAAARGWPLLLLLGDPAYYGRFGFVPAAASASTTRPPDATARTSWCASSGDQTGAALPRGEYRYCWEL